MPRDRLPYLILPLAALLAVLPLVLHGPSCGHDFDFHILNWLEAAAQFRHGNLHPHWAFSAAWNAGEPRFVFYPPLSWTLGAIMGLILPWTWSPVVYTWLAFTASGLAMHRLARAHAGPTAALLASTLYLANPYMLFTAYERTAYAELLAAAWFPLLFHAILKPRPTIPAIAIPLALLWLTNAPAAVMGSYTLALLAAIRLAIELSPHRKPWVPHPSQQHREGWGDKPLPGKLALTTLAGTLSGLALAAFYILPAVAERPLVQIAMVVIPGMRIDDNTLFHHTGFTEDALAHDAVLHSASVLAVALLTLTAIALLWAIVRLSRTRRIPVGGGTTLRTLEPNILSLAILTLTIAVLLTPAALPIWHHAPELAFLQFPWRLLAVLATVLGLATALALNGLAWKTVPRSLATLAIAAALTTLAAPVFRQACDPEDTVPARLASFQAHSGSEPTDEYTPAPADNDSLHPHNPPFWLSPDPDAEPPANLPPGSPPPDFTINSAAPQYLILNLRRYRGWQVILNGSELAPNVLAANPRADGLFDIPVPAHRSHISVAYRTGPLEHLADATSLLAAIALIGVTVYARRAQAVPGWPKG